MSDIKIEKTAGGYTAAIHGQTRYSVNGIEWMNSRGLVLLNQDELRDAFITQYIDPPTEQPAPKFKVGDRVVCVHSADISTSPMGSSEWSGTITKITTNGTHDYVHFKDACGWGSHRFTLAPKPKVYTGDPKDWGEGVYRQVSTKPFIILMDEDGDSTMLLMDKYNIFVVIDYVKHRSESYHRIANSISDIFVNGIMDMEAI